MDTFFVVRKATLTYPENRLARFREREQYACRHPVSGGMYIGEFTLSIVLYNT